MSAASSFPTTLELHESVLSSLADLYLHGGTAVHMGSATAACVPSGGAGRVAEANQRSGAVSGESIAQAIWQDVWRRHGVLPLDTVPSTLERVRNLEALGTVGGRWGGTALGTVGGRWGGGDASQPQIDRQNLASGMIIVPWGRCVEAALDGHPPSVPSWMGSRAPAGPEEPRCWQPTTIAISRSGVRHLGVGWPPSLTHLHLLPAHHRPATIAIHSPQRGTASWWWLQQ